jgi:hypothetical protein
MTVLSRSNLIKSGALLVVQIGALIKSLEKNFYCPVTPQLL